MSFSLFLNAQRDFDQPDPAPALFDHVTLPIIRCRARTKLKIPLYTLLDDDDTSPLIHLEKLLERRRRSPISPLQQHVHIIYFIFRKFFYLRISSMTICDDFIDHTARR